MRRLLYIICFLFVTIQAKAQLPQLDLSMNPQLILVQEGTQTLSVTFRSSVPLNISQAIIQLNQFFEAQGCNWLRVVSMRYPGSNQDGIIIIQLDTNPITNSRECIIPSTQTGDYLKIRQINAASYPQVFTVGGYSMTYPGKMCHITLSGSEEGVTYQLYAGSTLVQTLTGTGNALVFSVSNYTGTFTVKGIKNQVSCNMSGNYTTTMYPLLLGKLICSNGSYTIPKDGGSVSIPFRIDANYQQGISELMEIVYSCMAGESSTWPQEFVIDFRDMQSLSGNLIITAGPNCTSTPLQATFITNIQNNISFKIEQPQGGSLKAFNLSGGGEVAEGSTGTVALSGRQQFVTYNLFLNDVQVSKYINSNNCFIGLTDYGNYKVKAIYGGQEVWMNGEIGIWPKITRSTVGGGGTLTNNNPVPVTLPTSQDILNYRLLKNGVVVNEFSGTGQAISFNVMEPGTYTISAGLQDYYVAMNGSATVTQGSSSAIYFTETVSYAAEKLYLDPTPESSSSVRSVNNVVYTDGFGRKLQEIAIKATPDGMADIITPYVYGVLGRTEREYLPYARTGNQGGYHSDLTNGNNWSIYGSEDKNYAYTVTEYDNSPLDRPVKQTGPGEAWHVSDKSVTIAYALNGANEVRLYRVSDSGMLVQDGWYSAGTLSKTTTTDEDANSVQTFTDNQDRVLLTVATDGSNLVETYSVYDDRGQLRYVLSPEASNRMAVTIDEAVLEQYAYSYDYDLRGRMISKKLPGCEPMLMAYDKKDRMVMSQDGKQRAESANKWSYSIYDRKNRVVETGEVELSVATSHADLQAAASTSSDYLPVGDRTALQYTLYDTYAPNANVPVHAFTASAGYSSDYHNLIVGMATSVNTRVLGSETWLTTTTYYDKKGQVIQTVSDNIQGGISRMDMKYDFVGNLLSQRECHIHSGRTDVLETVNTYDDRGRLLTSSTTLNGGDPADISYAYGNLGRLTSKTMGSTTETMGYNIRGWLAGKSVRQTNNPAARPFTMHLRYNDPRNGATARWNGNISEWTWRHDMMSLTQIYCLEYDPLNRLTGTNQRRFNGSSWEDISTGYHEKGITYDLNGNILTMQRTADRRLVDDLSYNYTGNQLTELSEAVRTAAANDVYAPGAETVGTYAYDANGNMVNDSRKNLNFSYNSLNLVDEVAEGTQRRAKYTWLANGGKLRVRDADGYGFDYLGSLTYTSGSDGFKLETANFGGGVIRTGDGSGNTESQEINYFLTDHLGSVRVIVDADGVVRGRNDYYAFGAKHANPDYAQSDNRYDYNGKEEQTTGSLGYLDYGARMYDSALGRWFNVDPLAEKSRRQSSYHYASNNPVNRVDPDGKRDRPFNKTIHQGITVIPAYSATPAWTVNTMGNMVLLSGRENAYNCHSYAWFYSVGDPKHPNNRGSVIMGMPLWVNDPSYRILYSENIRQLTDDDYNFSGDKVVYYIDNNDNGIYDEEDEIVHSAIVHDVDSDGYTISVIGKMGQGYMSINHPATPGYYDSFKKQKTKRAYFREETNRNYKFTEEQLNMMYKTLEEGHKAMIEAKIAYQQWLMEQRGN